MRASVRALAAALAMISLCPGFAGEASEPTSQNSPVGRTWFVLYSSQRGPARFVSFGPGSEVLYVEATSPNLEVAALIAVRRGALPQQAAQTVNEVQGILNKMTPNALASLRSAEAIERGGLFVDIATCRVAGDNSHFGLVLEALPADAAESLRRVAAEAARLEPRQALSLIRVMPVDPERAKQIRDDPRRIYTFVPVAAELQKSLPHLTAALHCPGLVTETNDTEDGYLRQWLRESNPKMMGLTLFLSLEGNDFQVHFQSVAKPD